MDKRELIKEIQKLTKLNASEIIALSNRPIKSLESLLEMLKK